MLVVFIRNKVSSIIERKVYFSCALATYVTVCDCVCDCVCDWIYVTEYVTVYVTAYVTAYVTGYVTPLPGIQGQAQFQQKMMFRIHSTDSYTHRKMTLRISDRVSKASKIRQLPSVSSTNIHALHSHVHTHYTHIHTHTHTHIQ